MPEVSDVAFRLRMDEETCADLIDQLIDKQLLDRTPNGVVPHDWSEHQYASDSSTERVKRFRQRQAKQSETPVKRYSNATEQNRTEQIQSRTDTEQIPSVRVVAPFIKQALKAADLNGQTSQKFEDFWTRYPRKQHRDAACMEWLSVVTVESEPQVFGCLSRYLASDEVARGAVQNPEKWLYEQHRDGWAGDWPKFAPRVQDARETPLQSAIRKAKEEKNGTR